MTLRVYKTASNLYRYKRGDNLKGFQYLEQRDTQDAITKEGVVSKKTPFATADNAGIYDTIAENFRYLKDELDNITNTSEISSIRDEVKQMYEQMKTDGNFGEVAAKAQAQEALKQAKAAAESASKASASEKNVQENTVVANDLLGNVKSVLAETKSMLDRIKTMATEGEKKLTEAETSIENSKQKVTSLEDSVKKSESNIQTMALGVEGALAEVRSARKEVANNTTLSQERLTYFQTASEEIRNIAKDTTASKESASESASSAKAWATSKGSPDDDFDLESPTGLTQSSKGWALESRQKALDANQAMTTIRELRKAVELARDTAVKAESSARAIQSVVDVAMGAAQQALADIQAIRNTIVSSVSWKGVIESYSDLPQNPESGWIYCIKSPDENNHVSAGDYLIWNGTSWDNAGKFIDMTKFVKLGDNAQFGSVNGYTIPEGSGEFIVNSDANGTTGLGYKVKIGNIDLSCDDSGGINFTDEGGGIVRLENVKASSARAAATADNAVSLGGKTLDDITNIMRDMQENLKNALNGVIDSKANERVNKHGDTIDGKIVFAHDTLNPERLQTIRSVFPAHYYHHYWREDDRTTYIHAYPEVTPPDNPTVFAFRVGTGNKQYKGYILDKDGFHGDLKGTADNATVAQYIANDHVNMRFHWKDQSGQPVWVWGMNGGDPGHSYVWNPSNFSVAHANTANRLAGTQTITGNTDWNTLTEPTTYRIQNCTMNDAHHAPLNEYNFGILVVHRLENGVDNENRTVQIYYPHRTRGYWSRLYNGPADYRAENWLPWVYIPTHDEVNVIAEQKASTKVNKSGDTMTGDLTASSIYANDWFRVNGENNGIHWQKYGGGWYMTDKEWIRAWGGKGIYTSGTMKAGDGFEGNLRGTATNAERLGGKTLEEVIAMVRR